MQAVLQALVTCVMSLAVQCQNYVCIDMSACSHVTLSTHSLIRSPLHPDFLIWSPLYTSYTLFPIAVTSHPILTCYITLMSFCPLVALYSHPSHPKFTI